MIALRDEAYRAYKRHLEQCRGRLDGLTSLQQEPVRLDMAKGPHVEICFIVDDVLSPSMPNYSVEDGLHGYAIFGHFEEVTTAGWFSAAKLRPTIYVVVRMSANSMASLLTVARGQTIRASGYMTIGEGRAHTVRGPLIRISDGCLI
jgi:hypothetical protein